MSWITKNGFIVISNSFCMLLNSLSLFLCIHSNNYPQLNFKINSLEMVLESYTYSLWFLVSSWLLHFPIPHNRLHHHSPRWPVQPGHRHCPSGAPTCQVWVTYPVTTKYGYQKHLLIANSNHLRKLFRNICRN